MGHRPSAYSYACPKCKASPFNQCTDEQGQPIKQWHHERQRAANGQKLRLKSAGRYRP